ncbi:potassium channel family protein [Paenibacillus tyrfis]|uniref:potassium channel family protein n=1 Tax=Paenibacillus tyrfis TaxID=1501230 RepID=UPI0015C5C855|nr:potassium channel family protein [Paenibacillus tyrfis]
MRFWFQFRKLVFSVFQIRMRTLSIATGLLVLTSSVLMPILEPEQFPRVYDGLWWTVVTLATVGYGDAFPKTDLGRLWGIMLIVGGVGLFTLFIGRLYEMLVERQERRKNGDLDYTKHGGGHVVVIGWSGRARITIKNILKNEPSTDVVLIDDRLAIAPLDEHNFLFIRGIPSRDKTLHRARVAEAREILIFADESLKVENPYNADARTAFILTSVERIAGKVQTTLEVVLEENLANFTKIASNTHFRISDQSFAEQMYAGPKRKAAER